MTTPQGTVDATTLDLADPQTYIDHDPVWLWGELRDRSPVHWNEPGNGVPGFWAVTRYADVVSVYKDTKHFTSERGNVLSTLLQGHDSAAGKMLAVTDGAHHRAVRNLMLKSFSPRLLDHVAELVRQRTRDLFAGVVGTGRFDFASDVADNIPINTIGDLMDVPRADRQQLVEWNNKTLARHSSEDGEMEEWLARNEILMYFGSLAEQRRKSPGDDVVSALATGLVEGEPLPDDEIVFNCYSLILGADESSRMSSIGAIRALAENPDQWRALKNGDVSIESATEEVLRWTTPAMHFGRRAVADVEVGGTTVREGDVVTLWNSSANFDEAVFPGSERFDLARTPNKHLAFGFGPHFCLGAFLGRAHVGAVLGCLRDTVSDIRLPAEPTRLYSNFVYGYSSLPVELVP